MRYYKFGAFSISGEALSEILGKVFQAPESARFVKIVPTYDRANVFDVIFESPDFELNTAEGSFPPIYGSYVNGEFKKDELYHD